MKVGIVIVNYNGEKYQNDCIASLYQMTLLDFEIIVVDSGSKDNSIAKLRKEFPKVRIIEMNDNVGVARGNNVGIEYCRNENFDYILLLNNDIEVDSRLLEELVLSSEDKNVVVPKIYYYDPKDVLWYAGGELNNNRGTNIHYGIGQKDVGQYENEIFVDYAPTCCMLIPKQVFDLVGTMDEKYFMYYDDTDFCLRLYRNHIKIKYNPRAIMWHKVSSSTGGEASPLAVYYNTRNRFYYVNKNKDFFRRKVMIYSWLSNIVQFFIWPLRSKSDKYIMTAIYDYKKGLMGRKDNLFK